VRSQDGNKLKKGTAAATVTLHPNTLHNSHTGSSNNWNHCCDSNL